MSAFRGAEGWGKDANVNLSTARQIHVTNLNASGPGSFAEAVQATGHRVVIFDVAGDITLNGTLLIANPNIYIAGQTAPGEGICVRGATDRSFLRVRTNNVIIRGLRFRNGIFHEGDETQQGIYCIDVVAPSFNVIIDHCSFSFSDDTAVNFWNAINSVTVQNCIFAFAPWEALNFAGGPPYGSRASVLKNLFAHNRRRNPNVWTTQTELANNVIYNGRAPGGGSFKSGATVDVRGNVVIGGANTGNNPLYDYEAPNGLRVYVSDNLGNVEAIPGQYRSASPVGSSGYVPLPAGEVHAHVTENAGARPLDEIDQRAVNDVLNDTGSWILHPREIGGYPTLTGTPRTQDQWNQFVASEGGLENALESFYEPPAPPTSAELVRPENGLSYTYSIPLVVEGTEDIDRVVFTIDGPGSPVTITVNSAPFIASFFTHTPREQTFTVFATAYGNEEVRTETVSVRYRSIRRLSGE